MDDFDVVLGMEFLLKHQVIPMPSAKCLAITGSFPTVVQADIRQPNGFKMISAMQLNESPAQEQPHPQLSCLGRWENWGRQSPKTLCKSVCEEYLSHGTAGVSQTSETIEDVVEYRISRPVQASYGVHVLSLKKKDRNPQLCIDRRIQSKLTVRRKYPLPALTRLFDRPCEVKYFPKLDIRSRYYRVRTTKAKGLETTCFTGHRAYEFPVVSFSLIDAKGGKCCSVQSQINVLGHVVECHQSGLLREEDTQCSGNLECQATFNGLKQTMIDGPSLGVVDTTKTPKIEAEQFSYVIGILLPPLADRPYVGDRLQVHRVEEEWEQMADITRVCLEEASRPMEERVIKSDALLKKDREIKEVFTDRVRTGRRPTRKVHKFLVKRKKPLVEVTSGEHVKDLEEWMQKTEELQLRQLTRTSTIEVRENVKGILVQATV
ncbi:reverse transcriptase [Cucumis melo var. makuwa]|uniref:Reverse transcriptase n=1 Tax=Cucumis melo var. makuwa TaxID=1194695 RepID=A0A5D3C8E4_CUCMM|nr:reverse transcriptase [Cucumis melo var. makuwa]TYK07610.1 reverse transcriptase [Cucumis melo var. makuwa]